MNKYAIKKLPLNVTGMYNKVENPMSTRTELGEFEIEAESIEEARTIAASMVSDSEPNMICKWSEKHNTFIRSYKKEFVHPTTLYKYNGKKYEETIGTCKSDRPKSGCFLKKADAKADYMKHKKVADAKIQKALAHITAIEESGVLLDYQMKGDTHGIYEDYMYLQVKEGAHTFKHELNQ